jgi:hypothetical protein
MILMSNDNITHPASGQRLNIFVVAGTTGGISAGF